MHLAKLKWIKTNEKMPELPDWYIVLFTFHEYSEPHPKGRAQSFLNVAKWTGKRWMIHDRWGGMDYFSRKFVTHWLDPEETPVIVFNRIPKQFHRPKFQGSRKQRP